MRILFFAKDAPTCNSGYGKCVREISTRLKAKGHDLAIFATIGNQGTSLSDYKGIPLYCGTDNVFGDDIVADHYNHFKADVFLTQMDIWPLQHLPQLAAARILNWVAYTPIDFYPIPPDIIEKLQRAHYVVAMNGWVESELRKVGFTEIETIHHGIDSQVYKPVSSEERIDLKKRMGFQENCFLIGMVMANQPFRKAWEEQLNAVKIFTLKHPQIPVGLYIHSIPRLQDGWDIKNLVTCLGLERVTFLSNPYKMVIGYSENEMAELYNAMDVLLNVTAGEGFGLPIIEAQGCGTPVIATNFSSMPELVMSGAGELVKVREFFLVPSLCYGKARPDVEDLANKIELMYYKMISRPGLADWTKRKFDWDEVIIPKWLNLFDRLSEKFRATCTDIPKPSEELVEMAKKEVTA